MVPRHARNRRTPAAGARALSVLLALTLPSPDRAAAEVGAEPRAGMEFILVRGGSYRMGDFSGRGLAQERPAHPVTVNDFYLGRTEVTVAQFRAFVEATGYRTEAERAGGVIDIDPVMMSTVKRTGVSWSNPGFPQDERGPVVWVTWNDAAEYTRWLAEATGKPYRLPTEAEWEFAARERGLDLPWSGTADPNRSGEFAWFAENSGGVPHPVGGKTPNALGFHDMSGNVWEWCLDLQAPYDAADAPVLNPRGPAEGRFRALRGGSWRVGKEVVRTTYRNGYRPDYAHGSIGFRVALEIQNLL
jgi:formylglycine-generating enzyme required for sulfatase activity